LRTGDPVVALVFRRGGPVCTIAMAHRCGTTRRRDHTRARIS
jgi:hypothetical protein